MIPERGKAIMLARRQLSELVWDAVNLEGINVTLPEVQTLLEGILLLNAGFPAINLPAKKIRV
jgi:hypothetical protein